MKSLYSELIVQSEAPYDTRLVNAYIILIKKTKSKRAKEVARYKLYFLLSKVFVKAINNFNSLTRTIPKHKVLHSNEDIAGECFLILDKCVEKLKMEYIKLFYFYLNSSLNRAIYRIYDKQYRRGFVIIDNTEENGYLLNNKGYDQHIDFSEIDLMSLNEMELEVLKFKVTGNKLSIFLKEHKIPSTVYHDNLESAKLKLLEVYKDESCMQNILENDSY